MEEQRITQTTTERPTDDKNREDWTKDEEIQQQETGRADDDNATGNADSQPVDPSLFSSSSTVKEELPPQEEVSFKMEMTSHEETRLKPESSNPDALKPKEKTSQPQPTQQMELLDTRPRRDSGPNSDTIRELGPGRIKALEETFQRLESVACQTELDLQRSSVTPLKARETYNILVKLGRALRDRLVAVRYVKLSETYETSCAKLLNDCDILTKHLTKLTLPLPSEESAQRGMVSSKTIETSKNRSETDKQNPTQQFRTKLCDQTQQHDDSSRKGNDEKNSERQSNSAPTYRHSNLRSRSSVVTSASGRSKLTNSSTSSRRRIIRSEAAALEAKRQAMTRVEEIQRRESQLQNQMELERVRIQQGNELREIQEKERAIQRELEKKQLETQRKIDETRRLQEFENRIKQVKVEQEKARLQMDLDAAIAATMALEDTSPRQEVSSALSSLPKMDPVNELYLRRSDNQTTTFAGGVHLTSGCEHGVLINIDSNDGNNRFNDVNRKLNPVSNCVGVNDNANFQANQGLSTTRPSINRMNPVPVAFGQNMRDGATPDEQYALPDNRNVSGQSVSANNPHPNAVASRDNHLSYANTNTRTRHLAMDSAQRSDLGRPDRTQTMLNSRITGDSKRNQRPHATQQQQGCHDCACGSQAYHGVQQPQNSHYLPASQGPNIVSGRMLDPEATPFVSNNPTVDRPYPPTQSIENIHQQMSTYNGLPHGNTNPNVPREDNLAKSIADALMITRLPVPKPTVFKGDPLQYPSWFVAFSHLVKNDTVGPEDKMLILRDFIEGPAKAAVGDLYYDLSEDSYNSALEILKRRFGEDYTIAEALKEKLETWPDVKFKDTASLRNYADYIRQCYVMSKKITGLSILEDPAQIKRLAHKLPDGLALSWGQRVSDSKFNHGTYPSLATFVRFLESKCDALHEADLQPKTRKSTYVEGTNPNKSRGGQTFASTNEEGGEQKAPDRSGGDSSRGQPSRKFNGQRGRCLFCDDDHFTPDCKKLAEKTYEDRKEFAMKKRLCFKCLKGFHAARGCFAKVSCKICKTRHVTVMHDPSFTPSPKSNQRGAEDSEETEPKTIAGNLEEKSPAEGGKKQTFKVEQHAEARLYSLYMPVYVSAKSEPDNEILVYAMLDTMSDTSFLIEPVMEKLNLNAQDSLLTLRTLTSKRTTLKCKSFTDLRVRAYDSNETIEVPMAYSQRELSVDKRQIPTRATVLSLPHLRHLSQCFHPLLDAPIGLLLGVNVSEALRPVEVECGEPGQPYAQRTRLGWGLVGETIDTTATERREAVSGAHATTSNDVQTLPTRNGALCFRTRDHTNEQLIGLMERDFTCPDEYPTSQEDRKFIQILSNGIKLNDERHYQMPLPFRDGEPHLPNNRHMAMRRLCSLKRRFLTNPEHFRLYKEFVNQMLERRDAERVPDEEVTPGSTWYIPHHGVYHPNKPGKVRVVFDCAAKCQDVSLNDFLLCGPDLLNSLMGLLCRFRLYPVAVSCDVERMFHQFHVTPQHRNYLRFLWWPRDDLNEPPVDYRMRVHLFGAASSPGCANFALKTLARDNQHISQEAASFIQNDFYVDDGLNSRENATEAIKLLKGAREICEKGNLRLHKIASNSTRVMSAFPDSEVVKPGGADENEEKSENSIERALGIRWNLGTDTLHFRYERKEMPVTKRGVLSTVASIFDPLGLVSPIILKGRQILQEACREGIDWDEQLPPPLLEQWNVWIGDLKSLSLIQIPRCYFIKAMLPWTMIEFHHFADASTKGYGECSYIRLTDRHGNPHSSLVMAKSKVAPIRTVTIPRLELQAAVLAVKIARFLDKEFNHLQAQHHFWTDSRVVLGYIYNETRKFHVFVANRIQQIRDFSKPQQWHHVTTDQNPADHASRGLSVEDLKNSNWQAGPECLSLKTIKYDLPDVSVENDDKEVKAFSVLSSTEPRDDIERLVERFSTLEGLLRVVVRMITWRHLVRKPNPQTGASVVTPLEDREAAFKRLVRAVQLVYYPPPSRSAHAELKRLCAFTDDEGVLRVGGRLANSSEEHRVKHPLILPRETHLAVLLTRYHHRKVGHQGRTTTIGALQSNGLWICGVRRLISSVIHRCVHCARLRGRPMTQKMADLPPDRTEVAPPFTNTGLDCFGPFNVRDGRKEVKRYGLIFTCLVSRAVHLEVLEDMTSDAFICGLRRFIAIRGNVRTIRCDRGTNFVGAARELRQARREMNEVRIVEEMVERNCNFSFNPPSASHFGGVWERLIRTVRQVLSGLLCEHGGRLTSDTLSTLFHEVAGIVNNRPLCVTQLEDPTSCEPLTPNHLLTLKPEPVFPPPGSFQKEDLYSRKRWRRVQYLVNQFWTRWKKEYLPTLQPRRKWFMQKDAVKTGMVVLMSEEGAPRGTWKLARIEKTYPGDDGLVRSVQLRLATVQKTTKGQLVVQTTFLDRPIHKLVPLNLEEKG